MQAFFGILTAIVTLVAVVPYVRDMFAHKTKPQRTSFLIWALLGLIAFFSQLADEASWSLLLPLADATAVLIIFLLSINYGVGGFNREDKAALLFSAVGLLLWYLTDEPLFALIITILIDASATALTIHKTYRNPHTETFISWLLASVAGITAMLAVGDLDLSLLIYPIYIFLSNGIVALLILAGKNKQDDTNKPI